MVEQDKNQISEQEAELYDRQIRYRNKEKNVWVVIKIRG
jgi:hypothetical protein